MNAKRRSGYAHDVCLNRTSYSLDDNIELLAADLRRIRSRVEMNIITFAPGKQDMIHLTGQQGGQAILCVADEQTIIYLISPSRETT